ncbi:MAG: DHA2 family efflux MFS transporter permease subunit [Chloroflexi bacterium]|nr:DHA2 family efflux MFS transporter permease subunit [Chloroflexota bacterium]MBI3733404.1 DHA2 family efflux MFS transporter permease subunit [Chloroflexota bacterium]
MTTRPFDTLRQAQGAKVGMRPRWVALLAISLGVLIQPLNSTMLVVALPRIGAALGVDAALSAWLITAYLLATVIAQPTLGKLGDRLGHRRMFLAGEVVSGLGALAASAAGDFPSLVLFRVVQAVAGAALVPSGVALLRDLYGPHERGRALGIYSAALGLTAAAGPVLGGYLLGFGDWPVLFYVSVPVIALSIALMLYAVPQRPAQDAPRHRFDVWGAVTAGAALLGFLLALSLGPRAGWTSAVVVVSGVAAVVFGILFFAQERRHPEPVVNLRFFRNPAFASAVASIFFQNMVMYSTLILIPLFLQNVQKRPASDTGVLLAVMSATSAVLTPIGGSLSDRVGRRWPVVFGALLVLAGVSLQITLRETTSLTWIAAGLAAAGMGLGLSSAAMQTAAIEAFPADVAGSAAGLYSTLRYLGSTIGSALIAIALAGESNSAAAFGRAFSWFTLAALAAVASAWGLPTKGPIADSRWQIADSR